MSTPMRIWASTPHFPASNGGGRRPHGKQTPLPLPTLPAGWPTKKPETPGIGQNAALPRHKPMEPPGLFQQINARSKPKMIGVTEDQVVPQRFQVLANQSLNRSLSPHRHKDGGFHRRVGQPKRARPGGAIGWHPMKIGPSYGGKHRKALEGHEDSRPLATFHSSLHNFRANSRKGKNPNAIFHFPHAGLQAYHDKRFNVGVFFSKNTEPL
jgi:hypothetical protein